jgi:Pentapeptide repeats (8 copies)
VTEVLVAYLHRRTPRPTKPPSRKNSFEELRLRASDVQAALTVLGRRRPAPTDPRLDLRALDLRRADLNEARLSGALFGEADLSGADLRGAELGGADLNRADLPAALLNGANLRAALLTGADLSMAELYGADLGGAIFTARISAMPCSLTRISPARTSLRRISAAPISSAQTFAARTSVARTSVARSSAEQPPIRARYGLMDSIGGVLASDDVPVDRGGLGSARPILTPGYCRPHTHESPAGPAPYTALGRL